MCTTAIFSCFRTVIKNCVIIFIFTNKLFTEFFFSYVAKLFFVVLFFVFLCQWQHFLFHSYLLLLRGLYDLEKNRHRVFNSVEVFILFVVLKWKAGDCIIYESITITITIFILLLLLLLLLLSILFKLVKDNFILFDSTMFYFT